MCQAPPHWLPDGLASGRPGPQAGGWGQDRQQVPLLSLPWAGLSGGCVSFACAAALLCCLSVHVPAPTRWPSLPGVAAAPPTAVTSEPLTYPCLLLQLSCTTVTNPLYYFPAVEVPSRQARVPLAGTWHTGPLPPRLVGPQGRAHI